MQRKPAFANRKELVHWRREVRETAFHNDDAGVGIVLQTVRSVPENCWAINEWQIFSPHSGAVFCASVAFMMLLARAA